MRYAALVLSLLCAAPLGADEPLAAPQALSPATEAQAQPLSPAAAALPEPGAQDLSGAAEVIEAPPQNVEAVPAEAAKELPKESVPGEAVAEKPEPRFKLRNFLLGFVGGGALGAVFGPMAGLPQWEGAAIGGGGLGVLALLLGATTAPEARPPTVKEAALPDPALALARPAFTGAVVHLNF